MNSDHHPFWISFLTVVVIDDDAFTELFGATIRLNEEGEIIAVGEIGPAEGRSIHRGSGGSHARVRADVVPGAVCLALAWKHRGQFID